VAQPVPQAGLPQGGWPAAPQNSNKAIASLVCGVLFMCAPASIAAIILGHLALVDIKRTAGRMAGKGMAIAGLQLRPPHLRTRLQSAQYGDLRLRQQLLPFAANLPQFGRPFACSRLRNHACIAESPQRQQTSSQTG
jgi:hypothetical protein